MDPLTIPDVRNIHVLHVVPGLLPAGMELTMSRVVSGLAVLGMKHSVVCLKGHPLIRDRFPAGVQIYCMHSRPNELALPWRLSRLIRRVRPSVIHARNWGAWPDVAVARLTIWPPVPLIFSFHGFARPDRIPLRRRCAFRALSRMTSRLFTVSEGTRQMLVNEFGWPRGRVGVIPNGVDTMRFRPSDPPRGGPEPLRIGTVGSLTPVKNQALLVRACAALSASGVAWRLHLAGDGPEHARLRNLAERLGAADRVLFEGQIDDIPRFLQSLDVFVLPSSSEAHPNALLEAMACGLPCIATDVGGVSEILGSGAFGRVVRPHDLDALRHALKDLAGSVELRRRLGNAARQSVCRHYGLERMLQAYAVLYHRTSHGRPMRPSETRPSPSVPPRPRVLMLGPLPPLTGGMATVTDNLRHSALARRCRLTVLNNGKTTPKGRSLLTGLIAQLRLLARIVGCIRRFQTRIVHVQTCALFSFWRDSLHLLVARALGCQVILHIHDGSFEKFLRDQPPLRGAILRRVLRMASRVIVLSRISLDSLQPLVPEAEWRVVLNGVPIPPRVVRSSGGAVTLLFLGNLTERKGAYDLLAATRLAKEQGFTGSVHLAGGETALGQGEAFGRKVVEEDCASQVLAVGFLKGRAKDAALDSADGFVLPSYVEGLPMAVLEAMAHGLPVIATRVGAVPEAVTDGREGFLIEPGDVEDLADRMLRLARDAGLRGRMGEAARRRAEADFSLDAMVDRIVALYDGLSS